MCLQEGLNSAVQKVFPLWQSGCRAKKDLGEPLPVNGDLGGVLLMDLSTITARFGGGEPDRLARGHQKSGAEKLGFC